MNTNCLVTKLKGTVSNENLATFDTAFIDYTGNSGNASVTILIATSSSGSCKLTFSTPFHIGTGSGTTTSSYTVTANNVVTFVVSLSELGNSPIQKLVKLEGIYNVKDLVCYGRGLSMTYNTANGLKSMLDYAPIEMYGGLFNGNDILPDKEYVYVGVDGDTGYEYNLDDYTTIKFFYGYNITRDTSNAYGPMIDLTDKLGNNTSIESLYGCRLMGDCKNVPVNVKVLHLNSGGTTGTIELLVTKMRNKGRTTGHIFLLKASGASNIYYNNSKLSTLIDNRTISVDSSDPYSTTLTWDANSISFTSTMPSDLTDYVLPKGPWQWYSWKNL